MQATACIQRSHQLFVIDGGAKKGCTLSIQHLSHWVGDAIAYAYSVTGRAVPSVVKCHSARINVTGNPKRCTLEEHPYYGLVGITSTFSRYYRVNVATPHPLCVVRQLSSFASSL